MLIGNRPEADDFGIIPVGSCILPGNNTGGFYENF